LPFQRRIAYFGLLNSLSQTLLKLTSPGVPDIYQGNEIWDFSLVDPDNRRPIDYRHREALLADLQALMNLADEEVAPRVRSLLDTLEDGRIKLYLTWKTLTLRRERSELFREGDYLPLSVGGAMADRVCAFARRFRDQEVLVVIPRLYVGLVGGKDREQPLDKVVWKDTFLELPERQDTIYVNILTRETVTPQNGEAAATLLLADVLRYVPVALLLRHS
jgi:(1->4)-alpha-D-glucan 1-alpha-D-glucosylmutase